jgi:hypothetical protein
MKIKSLLAILAYWVILLIISIQAFAYDPGHDTLYIFKSGDNLTGYLNVSQNVTGLGYYTYTRFSGANLTISSDGNPPSVSNIIAGSSTELAISSPILYLNKANNAMVYVGIAATPASFNISGALYLANTLVCLGNGTNCQADAGFSGNFTALRNNISNVNNTALGRATVGYVNCTAQQMIQNLSILNSTISGICITPTMTANDTSKAIQNDINLTGALCIQNLSAKNTTWTYSTITALTSYSETDPAFVANFTALKNNITNVNSTANLKATTGYVNCTGSNVLQNISVLTSTISGSCGAVSSSSGTGNVTSQSGNAGYIPLFQNTSASIINNSIMVQNANGIGISAPAPNEKLTVAGDVNITSATDVTTTVGSGALYVMNGAAGIGFDTDEIQSWGGALYFQYDDGQDFDVGNRDLYVETSGGNTGLGVIAPSAKLDVNSTSGAQLRLTYSNTSTYANLTVDNTGNLTIRATGGNVIIQLG